MNDFSTYKFRCSSLPTIMTNSKSKTDILSKTAKEQLRKVFIAVKYGRERHVYTLAMRKGTACESDSLDLFATVTGNVCFKNQKKFENDHVMGTPDVILPDEIVDIKTPFDIFTFGSVTAEKADDDYKWQMAGYCHLLGKTKARLVYALVNTPEDYIQSEMYKAGAVLEPEQQMIRKIHTFDDIDPKEKIKMYNFEFTNDDFALLEERIAAAREFLNGLSL